MLDGGRDAGNEAAPTSGDNDGVRLRKILHDLQSESALASKHVNVVITKLDLPSCHLPIDVKRAVLFGEDEGMGF